MLDYRDIIRRPDFYREMLARRGYSLPLEKLQELHKQRLELIQRVENIRGEIKKKSKMIGEKKRSGLIDIDEITYLSKEVSSLKHVLKENEGMLKEVERHLRLLMLEIPNVPAPHTPIGRSEDDNVVLRYWGRKPQFDFSPKSHDVIGTQMGILDFERGAKLAGARFTVLKGAGTILERALMQFFFDVAIEHGYTPVSVPYMVRREVILGTGQLPKFEDDLFKAIAGEKEWFLIPTAEVPVTYLHGTEILNENDLPLCYCALTPCFRAEAGSAGKDVKGLIRQHQFDKLEMVRVVKPENSWDELEILVRHAEDILQRLGLHYRVVALCTGDIGFHVQFTYDLEVWLPGQNAYREISSCSNCGDYQARRSQIRFRRQGTKKKVEFVHTLNGSGMPIGRTLVAILEQFQQEDGGVIIPKPLRKYTGFSRINPDGTTV